MKRRGKLQLFGTVFGVVVLLLAACTSAPTTPAPTTPPKAEAPKTAASPPASPAASPAVKTSPVASPAVKASPVAASPSPAVKAAPSPSPAVKAAPSPSPAVKAASPSPAAAGGTIKIVSSLPRTGSSKGQTDTIVNAIRMALNESGNRAGNFTITYEDMDDATAAKGQWDAAKEAENANRAVNDPDVMVYLGTFNSGAAAVSIPKVYVLDDTQLHDHGLAVVFAEAARRNGLEVVGPEGIDPNASDYRSLAQRIRSANPDLIYFGGITQNNAGKLWQDIRAAMLDVKMMGPDSIYEYAFLDAAGQAAEGTYITIGGIPANKPTAKGAEWYQETPPCSLRQLPIPLELGLGYPDVCDH